MIWAKRSPHEAAVGHVLTGIKYTRPTPFGSCTRQNYIGSFDVFALTDQSRTPTYDIRPH